jgi:hypothetical protein
MKTPSRLTMTARALIVFYSLSGNTEGLARDLAAALPQGTWDLEALRERKARTGWRGMVRCVSDSIGRRKPSIVAPRFRPADYDVVLVGTPIWMGRLSGPARTYLATGPFRQAKLGLFISSGGPPNAGTWKDIQQACPQTPTDVLQFNTRETHDVSRIDGFLRAMGLMPQVESAVPKSATLRGTAP